MGPSLLLHECAAEACGSDMGLKLCRACRAVYYCSKECQTGAWPQHKPDCLILREIL